MVITIITLVVQLLLYILITCLAKPILKAAVNTMDNWVVYSFFIEKVFSEGVEQYFNVENLCNAIFYFALMYLILCFIVRLIQVYFSWSNGDPETSPITVVMGFMKALIVMLVFGVCYEYFVEIIYQLYKVLIANAFNGIDIVGLVDNIHFNLITKLFGGIVVLVVAIEIFLIYIDVLTRGIQILILRLGTAFAAIGLLNADGGAFKGYIKKYIQNAFAVLVQIFMSYMSVLFLSNTQFIMALVTASIGLKGATMMKEFIGADTGSVGSGGLMSTMATAGQATRFAGGIAKRTGSIAGGVGTTLGKAAEKPLAAGGAAIKSLGQTIGSRGKSTSPTKYTGKGSLSGISSGAGGLAGRKIGGYSSGGKKNGALGTFKNNFNNNYSNMSQKLSASDNKAIERRKNKR